MLSGCKPHTCAPCFHKISTLYNYFIHHHPLYNILKYFLSFCIWTSTTNYCPKSKCSTQTHWSFSTTYYISISGWPDVTPDWSVNVKNVKLRCLKGNDLQRHNGRVLLYETFSVATIYPRGPRGQNSATCHIVTRIKAIKISQVAAMAKQLILTSV